MKIICIGRNYVDHINELKNLIPTSPVVFLKPDSSIIPNKNPFIIPSFSNNIHFETELVFKIDKVGKHISEKFAHKYYSKFTLGIDFTARDIQDNLKNQSLPWEISKGFDGATFVANKWFNVSDYNLDDIAFSLYKNDIQVQSAVSAQMIWKIDQLITYVSQFYTLKIGDIIFTGTPAGVGQVLNDDVLSGFIGSVKVFSLNVK